MQKGLKCLGERDLVLKTDHILEILRDFEIISVFSNKNYPCTRYNMCNLLAIFFLTVSRNCVGLLHVQCDCGSPTPHEANLIYPLFLVPHKQL